MHYSAAVASNEDSANARLIAAAPDLLAACRAVLAGVDMAAIEQVRAAVAKAENRKETSNA